MNIDRRVANTTATTITTTITTITTTNNKICGFHQLLPVIQRFLCCPGPWTEFNSSALEEARDICRYLRPLQPLFADLENTEFPDVKAQIRPLMHMVCLVWANSQYYNSPARIIVLLQATCNLFIQQVSCSQLLSSLWYEERWLKQSVISHWCVWSDSFLITMFIELKLF